MKRATRIKFMQPITRVHTIFRIRTIVNAVTEMNQKGVKPRDDKIGKFLAKTGLSKYRKRKVKDRIMRRARDHLLTAAYMGLLTRIGRPFGYSSTTAGALLDKYKFNEECPKDSLEEAIFTDKIMRLKLTNTYDMQLGCQYTALRSRPCVYVLHILKQNPWLHEHQIAIATGGERCDPQLIDRTTRKRLMRVSKYDTKSKQGLRQFYSAFKVTKDARKNMTRNIRPILDWCEALGLVESREYVAKKGRWYSLTERGEKIRTIYSSKYPLWYTDFGDIPNVKSAILLLYEYLQIKGLSLDKKILNQKVRIGLFSAKIIDLVKKIEGQLGVEFSKDYGKLKTAVDFGLEYDVPPENRNEVHDFLKIFCRLSGFSLNKVTEYLEKMPINKLRLVFQQENQTMRTLVTGDFAETTGISGSTLKKVSELVPSIGILSQYKSSFEKEVAILLRLMNLNAVKYQGQVSDRCSKPHIAKFFETNPDIFILNGLEILVECKSSGEWHSPLSSDKNVQKEFIIYQGYMPEAKTDSVLIVYEGVLDTTSKEFAKSLLNDAKDLILVTKDFLVDCVEALAKRRKLVNVIKNPRKFDALSRILVS